MTISLDSCLIIDVINGKSALARDRLLDARDGDEPLVISSLVFHEVHYGAAISKRPKVQAELLAAVTDGIPIEPFTAHDAAATTQLRRALRGLGREIGGIDTLIAGQALARGWMLVTSNTRDFDRVPDLKIVDWASPADVESQGHGHE